MTLLFKKEGAYPPVNPMIDAHAVEMCLEKPAWERIAGYDKLNHSASAWRAADADNLIVQPSYVT